MKKSAKNETAEQRLAERSASALNRARLVAPALRALVKLYSHDRINYGHVGTMAEVDDQLAALLTLLGGALTYPADLTEAELLAWVESESFKD